jgi:membrane-bound lytic murein transglycosylase D
MTRFRQLARRIALPAVGIAMGFSTLIAGLGHTAFLVSSMGTEQAVASVRAGGLDSTIASGVSAFAGSAVPADSASLGTVSPVASLDVGMSHSRIDQWVQRLTTSLKGDFAQSLTRMDRYAKMINAKLDAKQMPRELIYLAMIESNFNPTARSKVGAVGLWQFMGATARQFGLTVRGKTDERKDAAQATDAALTYLSNLHTQFGSWYLAAAAYNSGAGTVSKALMKVTGKAQGTDKDFFRILPSLPRETQDYVPKLIASARVGSDPVRYGF